MANSTNKIPVSFKLTRSDKLPEYHDGQIIFVENEQKIYLDFHGERVCYSGDGSSISNATRYMGIANEDPGETKLFSTSLHPEVFASEDDIPDNAIVAYDKKEYMWRKDETGEKNWYPLGDETLDGTVLMWEES